MNWQVITFLVIGLTIGFMIGGAITLNWVVRVGLSFLELKGIEIDVNRGELTRAIDMYKNNIRNCWEVDLNASLLTNPWN